MVTGEEYQCFIKEHFRPLKIKDNPRVRIGRRTYAWLLEQVHRTRFSHLTMQGLETLAAQWRLKTIPFDDGYAYVVRPEMERDVMVAFYHAREERDALADMLGRHAAAPVKDVLDSYGISEAAILLLTGDSVADLGLRPDSVVDFIDRDMVAAGMGKGLVRVFVEEGFFTVIAAEEDIPEGDVFTLVIQKPLPGTEVPISGLDLSSRTYITGLYRDQVQHSSHDFEHIVTRMNDS